MISSDIHQLSVRGPMYDLPTCLSKFLALGLSLEQVVEAATIAYALAHAGTALIDEHKATRICRERFPALRLACTTDVLIHGVVRQDGAGTPTASCVNYGQAVRIG